tara:strand:- start:5358 stop:5996 length:639 start_codon:yes stop_codon:yes gene_type:complete
MQSELHDRVPLENELNKQWDEERRLLNNHQVIEQEPMHSIQAKFFYLNTHQYIENIICEPIALQITNHGSILTKENLIKIIEQKKIKTKQTKYQFLDLILCNFDTPASTIYSFSKTKDVRNIINNHIKNVNPVEDIFIGSSIFPFHQINNLCFFFEEHVIENKPVVLKSILKDETKKNNKHTKKVRIVLQPKKELKNVRKTKLTKKHKSHIS